MNALIARTSAAVIGFPNDTQQEIGLLYDPTVMTARHAPGGTLDDPANPRFDTSIAIDIDTDAAPDPIRWSKPPLEVALEVGGQPLNLIGVHAKSKAPHGARDDAEAMAISIANRRKQLAQCIWLRKRVDQILDRIAELVAEHQTTLVFVNTRRLAERLAHQLGERLAGDTDQGAADSVVAAHHGSLSKDRRHRVERRLRAGELKALVATASLELGIDVGPVEPLPALDSFFRERERRQAQTTELADWIEARLGDDSGRAPAVLVTHQVNVTALTGEFLSSGTALIVSHADGEARVLATFATDVPDEAAAPRD